jgi:hypothetical protein
MDAELNREMARLKDLIDYLTQRVDELTVKVNGIRRSEVPTPSTTHETPERPARGKPR